MMTERCKELCNMIGVFPYDTFKIVNMKSIFYFNESLELFIKQKDGNWCRTDDKLILDLLLNIEQIDKLNSPSTYSYNEKIIILYCKSNNYRYLVKNPDGCVRAFTIEPHKGEGGYWTCMVDAPGYEIKGDISFISNEDKNPFKIENIEFEQVIIK